MNGTLIALVGFALVFVSEPALALRPYDSTDADVAKQANSSWSSVPSAGGARARKG